MKIINCIGCGRLGKAILKKIANQQAAQIGGIVNQSLTSAQKAADFIGQGTALNDLSEMKELPFADFYFITASDQAIQPICEKLIAHNLLKENTIIVHFSGALSSDILISAKKYGSLIASLHPIKSFADADIAYRTFKGTYCSIEGDVDAVVSLKALFQKIEANIFDIKKEDKIKYHAGLVIANNYLTVLNYAAVKLLKDAGVEDKMANDLAVQMMEEALANIKKLGAVCALTGPIQRGDIVTVQAHLDALKNDPMIQNAYAVLGQLALQLINN